MLLGNTHLMDDTVDAEWPCAHGLHGSCRMYWKSDGSSHSATGFCNEFLSVRADKTQQFKWRGFGHAVDASFALSLPMTFGNNSTWVKACQVFQIIRCSEPVSSLGAAIFD